MRPQRQIFVSEDAKVFIRGYKLWVIWVDLIEGRSAGEFFLCENKIPFVLLLIQYLRRNVSVLYFERDIHCNGYR